MIGFLDLCQSKNREKEAGTCHTWYQPTFACFGKFLLWEILTEYTPVRSPTLPVCFLHTLMGK